MPRDHPALVAWAGDPAQREATRARHRALARSWRAGTPLEEVARALDTLVDPSAEEVADLLRPLLAETDWLDTVVARTATAVGEDAFLDPPFVPAHGPVQAGLVLYQGPHAALIAGVGARDRIAAKRLRPRGGTVGFPGTLGLMRVIRSGGARLSLWRGGWAAGAMQERCTLWRMHALSDGEVLTIDGRDTTFVIEHCTGDMVLLQAEIFAGAAPMSCEYDVLTGDLIATGAALDDASRTQMLTTLLAALDMPDVAAFDRASRAAEPFVRWHAMRAWLATDAGAAGARLAEMARADPDAELRTLAERSLARCPA